MKALIVAILGIAISACASQPQYPNCNNDQACARNGHHEYCIRGACQACRTDADCPSGNTCVENRCRPAAYASRSQCDDTHACPNGQRCELGQCLAVSDVSAVSDRGRCTFPTVHFAFDDATLGVGDRDALQRTADCLQREANTRYVLLGRADPRGTAEYNVALGARRARAVQHFLIALGVADARLAVSSLGSEGATGNNESSWAQDRRVDPNRR